MGGYIYILEEVDDVIVANKVQDVRLPIDIAGIENFTKTLIGFYKCKVRVWMQGKVYRLLTACGLAISCESK
jgi:hypothetical protein